MATETVPNPPFTVRRHWFFRLLAALCLLLWLIIMATALPQFCAVDIPLALNLIRLIGMLGVLLAIWYLIGYAFETLTLDATGICRVRLGRRATLRWNEIARIVSNPQQSLLLFKGGARQLTAPGPRAWYGADKAAAQAFLLAQAEQLEIELVFPKG